jgi:hypothetical protein
MVKIEDRTDDLIWPNAWDIKTASRSFTVYAQVGLRACDYSHKQDLFWLVEHATKAFTLAHSLFPGPL